MSFEALYYPYVEIRNKETLKKAVLYFDKIHLLRPSDLEFNKISMEGILQNEGLIKIIDPGETLNRFNKIFDEFVTSDEKLFKKIYRDMAFEGNRYAYVYGRKMSERLLRRYRQLLRETDFPNLYKAPYPLVESVVLNHIFLLCSQYNYSPMTDNPMDEYFLKRKFENVAINMNNPIYQNLATQFNLDIRRDFFAQRVLEELIPTIKNTSLRKILDVRDDYKNELKRFRNTMAELSSEINVDFWDNELDIKIRKIIDKKLRRTINNLSSEIDNAKTELKNKLGKKAVIGSIGIIGTVFSGGIASIPLISLIGLTISTGTTTGSVALSFSDYIDYLKDKRIAFNKNSISYLFRI